MPIQPSSGSSILNPAHNALAQDAQIRKLSARLAEMERRLRGVPYLQTTNNSNSLPVNETVTNILEAISPASPTSPHAPKKPPKKKPPNKKANAVSVDTFSGSVAIPVTVDSGAGFYFGQPGQLWTTGIQAPVGFVITDSNNNGEQVFDEKVVDAVSYTTRAAAHTVGAVGENFPFATIGATPSPTGANLTVSLAWVALTAAFKSTVAGVPVTRIAFTFSQSSVAGTSASVAVPGGIQNGDVIVLVLTTDAVAEVITPPAGFTSVISAAGATETQSFLYSHTVSNDAGSYTFTLGTSSQFAMLAMAFRGMTATTDGTNSATGTGTAVTVPSVTTTTAFDEIVTVYGFGNGTNTSATTFSPNLAKGGSLAPTWSLVVGGFTQDNYNLWTNVGIPTPTGTFGTIASSTVDVLSTTDVLDFSVFAEEDAVNIQTGDYLEAQILDGATVLKSNVVLRQNTGIPITLHTSSPLYHRHMTGFLTGLHTFTVQARIHAVQGSNFSVVLTNVHFVVKNHYR